LVIGSPGNKTEKAGETHSACALMQADAQISPAI
jgi:hypothetical protein